MMDNPNTNIARMSDDAIIHLIGDFVKQNRLEQNITQQELAEKAGINRTTLWELESGNRVNLITLIQVLRILNKLHVFEAFHLTQKISPIKLAQLEMKKRQRAQKRKSDKKKKTDW